MKPNAKITPPVKTVDNWGDVDSISVKREVALIVFVICAIAVATGVVYRDSQLPKLTHIEARR